jgi:hypothetical protein
MCSADIERETNAPAFPTSIEPFHAVWNDDAKRGASSPEVGRACVANEFEFRSEYPLQANLVVLTKKFPEPIRRNSIDQTQVMLPELAIFDFGRLRPVAHRTEIDDVPNSEYTAML